MIDSHCHLNATYTAETVAPVLERFSAMSGKYVIDVSTTLNDLEISQEIIGKNKDMVYGNVGIHPESPNGSEPHFQELLQNVKTIEKRIPRMINIVGIGETGLDYSHVPESDASFPKVIEQQRHLFVEHLVVAKKYALPVIIHARGADYTDFRAYEEILLILKAENFSLPVYFHSFGGDYVLARKIVAFGYYLGVNGIATYSGAKNTAEVVEKIPSSQLLLETDSPFLIPSNMDRTQLGNSKINEPIGIFSTAKRVATLKKCEYDEVLESAYESAKKLFAKIL